MAGGTRILVDGGGGGPVSEVAGKESVAIHVQCYRDAERAGDPGKALAACPAEF